MLKYVKMYFFLFVMKKKLRIERVVNICFFKFKWSFFFYGKDVDEVMLV